MAAPESSPTLLHLHDHPVSSYAQKIRIALREKSLPFTFSTPTALGSGVPNPDLPNPRQEVPALSHGTIQIFDSTVILSYLDEAFPSTKPLLPTDAIGRANARMLEEVCDTHFEAANWAYGEVVWFGRAEGQLKEKLVRQIKRQAAVLLEWLEQKLGEKPFFHGSEFGYADVCAAAVVKRAADNGYGPQMENSLGRWLARIEERESVRQTFAEYTEGLKRMEGLGEVFRTGGAKREYRDHRLEFLIKAGGTDVVLEGLKKGNIRFSWPELMEE